MNGILMNWYMNKYELSRLLLLADLQNDVNIDHIWRNTKNG